jgi:hypothetical protein
MHVDRAQRPNIQRSSRQIDALHFRCPLHTSQQIERARTWCIDRVAATIAVPFGINVPPENVKSFNALRLRVAGWLNNQIG